MSTKWRHLLAIACGIFSMMMPLRAEADAVSEAISSSAEHISQERFGDAIRETEHAADRGAVHPDLSFNRGLAYLKRAQTGATESGDLAQAAAGFAEAIALRGEDAEAERGLEQTRLLIAQDRSQADTSPETASLGLFERVLLGISPWVLTIIGILGSLTLSVSVFMLASSRSDRKGAGSIVALIGALLFLPTLSLFFARHMLFDDARTAVVIADGAEVVDESGKRIAGRLAYRRGALLHIGPTTRGLAPLTGFTESGHVPIARLRILKTRQ